MNRQVKYPLGCSSATPEYTICNDFYDWLAYGMSICWLGCSGEDPNDECYFCRPITREDVDELRCYFLDLVETVVVALWKGDVRPGDGCIDGDFQSLIISEDECSNCELLTWHVRLGDDSLMFELSIDGADPICIWLAYEAIENRAEVLRALQKARATVSDSKVYGELLAMVDALPADNS